MSSISTTSRERECAPRRRANQRTWCPEHGKVLGVEILEELDERLRETKGRARCRDELLGRRFGQRAGCQAEHHHLKAEFAELE